MVAVGGVKLMHNTYKPSVHVKMIIPTPNHGTLTLLSEGVECFTLFLGYCLDYICIIFGLLLWVV